MDLGADRDYCRVVFAFNLTSGNVDGVDVGGVGAALIVDAPKLMTEGDWNVGLFIDELASDEQAEALTQVFSGALGGPPAALGPLIGEFLGVERAPYEWGESGRTHSLTVGAGVDMEVEDVVSFGSPSDTPAQVTKIFYPFGSTITIARAKHGNVNAMGIQYEGHSAYSNSEFAWAG
jgi:hypothetical protein